MTRPILSAIIGEIVIMLPSRDIPSIPTATPKLSAAPQSKPSDQRQKYISKGASLIARSGSNITSLTEVLEKTVVSSITPKRRKAHRGIKKPRSLNIHQNDSGLEMERNMDSSARRQLRRQLIYRAKELEQSCQLPLPSFDISGSGNEQGTDYTVKLLTIWWDWLDACRNVLEIASQSDEHDYDWSPLNDVFGTLGKLRGTRGEDHHHCLMVLKSRGPWVSKCPTMPDISAHSDEHPM